MYAEGNAMFAKWCEKFPVYPIVVDCPLCGEKRRYRPSEVYLGRPDAMITKQWML